MTEQKYLACSDIQFPLQDKRAVDLWLKVLKGFKPDMVDLIGDIDNADPTSRWAAGNSEELFYGVDLKTVDRAELLEIALSGIAKGGAGDTAKFISDIRSAVRKADIHLFDGNHGWTRHETYLNSKAPDLLEKITPDLLYGLTPKRVTWHRYDGLPYNRFNDMYVHHGESISKHSGESVKADMDAWGVSLIRGHCFSADTEILTELGWKAYTEISVGDRVYTLNRDTNLGEWQPIEEKFVYDDFDSLVSIKSRNLDLLVTDGHGIVYHKRNKTKWETVAAGELNRVDRAYLPAAAITSDADLLFTDAEIRMLAWIVAEGNFDWYTTASGERRFRVRLSQSEAPDGRLQRLESLFGELDWKWNPILRYSAKTTEHGQWRNYDAYRISCRREDAQGLVNRGLTEEKVLRPEMLHMSARQANIYLMEYVWADGCKNSSAVNSWQLGGNDFDNVSTLQALAVRAGYRTSLIPRPRGMYVLTINSRPEVIVEPRNISTVGYSGAVWCVTVPNHTLMVRRNGKAVITMNSHRLGDYHKTFELTNKHLEGYEIGHLMDIKKAEYMNQRNWQQGFIYGYVVDGQHHLTLVKIKSDYTVYVDGKKYTA